MLYRLISTAAQAVVIGAFLSATTNPDPLRLKRKKKREAKRHGDKHHDHSDPKTKSSDYDDWR